MTIVPNDHFYTRLPVNEIPLAELLTEGHLFYSMPADWLVVIADVKNSTLATQQGLHETVNLVATGCIVAVLNIAYKSNITVPFFFGGDGATFLVPPSILDDTMLALLLHQQNTQQQFNFYLRVGMVPVSEIYSNGMELKISKFKTSAVFSIPVILGSGLSFAEQVIKGDNYMYNTLAAPLKQLDLTGMECRWDKIKPPQNGQEVVSILVLAAPLADQPAVFKKVIEHLDKIYGDPPNRRPISADRLKLHTRFSKIRLEMRSKLVKFKSYYLVRTWIENLLGYFYFKTKKGRFYLTSLVDMSDTLVMDGRINTIISGTIAQRTLLETALNEMESQGDIIYGLHVSSESVMSCYVRNMHDKHIHFVDGADGGYTMAAGIVKKKISR